MRQQTSKILQANQSQYSHTTENTCCAQPVDGSACCNKEADSDDCCAQPTDGTSCC